MNRKSVSRANRGTILAAAALIAAAAGCSSPPPPRMPLNRPAMAAEPATPRPPTLLERLREATERYELERIRADELQAQVDSLTETGQRLETEAASLRKTVEDLEQRLTLLGDVQTRYEEAQTTLMELGETVRDLQRQLLQERLARVKNEQTIVSLKLESAREQRQRLIEEGRGSTGTIDKPTREEGPDGANL